MESDFKIQQNKILDQYQSDDDKQRQKDEDEKIRVTNLKKSLAYAMHVQVTKKNIERGSIFINQLKQKIIQNNQRINMIKKIHDCYNCIPLNVTS